MKIIHCLNSPHIGGIERLVIDLAVEQKKKGLNVTIMLNSRKGQYYEYLEKYDIPIIDSNIESGFEFNPIKNKYLKQIFGRFDIIHLHSFSAIRNLAALNSGVNTVYTIHGLSKGIRNENIIKYYIRETLKKYFLNKVTILIANSNYTLKLAKKHYGLKKIITKVILNGVKIIKNKKNIASKKELTIGLVSRFTTRKRIDRLINSFSLFKEMGGIGKLILVGNGSTFNIIKNKILNIKYSNDITLTGYKENVHEYYDKFNLVVHPSDNEGFGLVAVEAYMHGIPIIGFNDSGGLKEIIEPIEPENIVKDETHLAERMLYYLNNKNLISDNAEKRIAYAKNNFSIERMERDYFKVYNELLLA